jgi:hypothetical protein
VAAGGTHHRSGVTVSGIGTSKAAKIWYRALTYYMTSGTNFSGARTATLNAAADLYGSSSAEYNTVATAWCAVGVGRPLNVGACSREVRRRNQRWQRPTAEKESQRWLTSLERTQQRVPENVTMVTIADRKADIFDLIVFPRREGY